MKTDKEILQELLDENRKGLYARQLDIQYHKEVLEPRFVKVVAKAKKADKEGAKARLAQNTQQMENLEILCSDLEKIIKMCKTMLKKVS